MLVCSVCKKPILRDRNVYRCENGHSFDIAKKGYVNLLRSRSKSQHGDDKLMALARRAFLDGGYYRPLADRICESIRGTDSVLDIGCGECYYAQVIKTALGCEVFGIDISKEILEAASPRVKACGIHAAVASCKDIPISDGSIGAVISVFAPIVDSEVTRVLKRDGVLVRVVPGKRHLWELKAAVYDTPRENEPVSDEVLGFEIQSREFINYRFRVNESQMLQNLFAMTPYYYTTSPADRQKLTVIDSLEITAEFEIITYKKFSS